MAATKPKTPESVLSPKAQGVALFLQFKRNTGTQQMIIVSEAEFEGVTRPAYLLTRQISEESPRRPWDVRTPSASTETDPAKRAAATLDFFSKWFQASFNSENWDLKEQKLAVEVSAQDYAALAESKSPEGMIQRIAKTVKYLEEEEASA